MRYSLLTVLLSAASAAPLPAFVPPAPRLSRPRTTATVDHAGYDQLLKKYVDARGLVNYRAWQKDQQGLNQYLDQLSRNPPAAGWSRPEQLAYWINAYNAYTIRLILDHYPVRSIKDIGPKLQLPRLTTPWAAEFFRIGGEQMSLDHIEHGILRKQYDDPRIHFALVCAARSCPRLRREAYTAAKLNQQLDAQGQDFLNDQGKNRVGTTSAQLSRYFEWYRGDWTRNGQSVGSWVNRYSTTKLQDNARISYLEYNWQLNEQP